MQNWDAATILFTFWVQSFFIGLFSAIKLIYADTALLAVELGKGSPRVLPGGDKRGCAREPLKQAACPCWKVPVSGAEHHFLIFIARGRDSPVVMEDVSAVPGMAGFG